MDGSYSPNTPLGPPPSGQTSDFNSTGLQPALIGVHASFIALMIVVVALRVYVRAFVIHRMGWDDYCIIVAAILTIVSSVLILYLLPLGFGKHLWDIRLVTIAKGNAVKKFSTSPIVYPVAIFFTKLSVALLYWRIFGIADRSFRIATRIIIWFCAVFYSGLFAVNIADAVKCGTTAAESIPLCAEGSVIITLIGALGNVITDIYLLILPMRYILQMRLSWRKKLGVIVVLGAGGLSTAASLVRLIITVAIPDYTDFLYKAAMDNLPTTIELCLGIVAASIATLPKLNESRAYRTLSSMFHSIASSVGQHSVRSHSKGSATDVAEPSTSKEHLAKPRLDAYELPSLDQ